jgi:hypothetical protein
VVQAHLDGDRTPSVRAVLDHFMRAVDYSAAQAWAGDQPPTEGAHPLGDVRRHVARQQAGDYVDCHVWPLTPQVFAGLLDDLLALGQVDFAVERITATRVGDQEFYATLRRLDRRRDPAVATEEARAALARLRSELPDEAPWRSGDADLVPSHVVADLEHQLAETRERLAKVRSARDRARRERDRARAEVTDPVPTRSGTGLVGRLGRRLRP